MTKTFHANTVKNIKFLIQQGKKGFFSAGDGLYLKVNNKNSASWFFRYQLNGVRRKIGLGSYKLISLSDARKLAYQQKLLLLQGKDPYLERKRFKNQHLNNITFDQLAQDFIKTHRTSWRSNKHHHQWKSSLENYAKPVIGHLPPNEITTEHLLKILNPIWANKYVTANRVRNRIEIILNVAKVKQLREGENPARWHGHLELLLPKRNKTHIKHFSALNWREMPAFWQALIQDQDISAYALQLLILTGLRTNEVLWAQWHEFDFKNNIWTIPKERMKSMREHQVPLSREALTLLKHLPQTNSSYLFTKFNKNKPINNRAMLIKCNQLDGAKYLKDKIGWRDQQANKITVHGFRSTFRDWAAEQTHFENIVVEKALAHTIGNAVEAAYRRGSLLEKRKELMQAWAIYVTSYPYN